MLDNRCAISGLELKLFCYLQGIELNWLCTCKCKIENANELALLCYHSYTCCCISILQLQVDKHSRGFQSCCKMINMDSIVVAYVLVYHTVGLAYQFICKETASLQSSAW